MKIESHEKRKVEKPRLPRTARKISTSELQSQMDNVGVDIDKSEEASAHYCKFVYHSNVFCNLLINVISLL